MTAPAQPWFDAGIGLEALSKLAKRYGSGRKIGWEDGVLHQNGISDGTWLVLHNATGKRLRAILALYATQADFLNDCP